MPIRLSLKMLICIFQFFQLVNERRVIMSDEAEILLKKYFVASRKIRSGTECISVPQGALKTL